MSAAVVSSRLGDDHMTQLHQWTLTALGMATIVLGLGVSTSAKATPNLGTTTGATIGRMSESEFNKVKFGGGLSLEWPVGVKLGVRSGVYWSSRCGTCTVRQQQRKVGLCGVICLRYVAIGVAGEYESGVQVSACCEVS
jgi:hypothetical protein